nr:cation-translocating P-type ATPase [Candidatus Rhodoblastus alkanivorans]
MLVILAIVVLNAIIGLVQDYRAERAIVELKRLAALKAVVLRDGRLHTIPAAEAVRGDIALLEAGAAAPADLRLIEAPGLKMAEAALTGESTPVLKQPRALADAALALGDRVNMAFKGSTATYGHGRGVVVATGMATELGRIAALMQAIPPAPTPLQRRLSHFGRRLALALLAICALVFALGLLRGAPPLLMLMTAVSLAVAAIPEALPAVVTVMLALGAQAMARRNALARRLPAIETLGSVSFIGADKTGTLTLNQMRVVEAFVAGRRLAAAALDAGDETIRRFIDALALCNDAAAGEAGEGVGDPMEVALWRIAAEKGRAKERLEKDAPRIKELPFDSDRKRMTTFHRDGDRFVAFTKGAPETLVPLCGDDDFAPERARLLAIAEDMAADGLRVLAVAARAWDALPATADPAALECGLTFLGFVGLQDPPRPEAKAAAAQCRAAGITTVMITGDHPVTARAIAAALGMLAPGDEVMTGPELRLLSDAELAARMERTRIFARVDPEQKLRIVEAVQARGAFVAMTGDGVNDAPALLRADIGVAMGKSGTDVAREASALVLLDDNFATIVAAIAEGRRIYDNIRKFISYILTCNAGEIWTILLAPFFGLPIPLLPIQILWINLVTDGLPGMALAAEPAERDIMRRPPRPADESIFARGTAWRILWGGVAMGAMALITQAGALRLGVDHWQTMVFTVLTLSQMGNVLAIRSERDSLFRQGLFSNPPLLGAVVLTIFLQLAAIYAPTLNALFHTSPLTARELAACVALSTPTFMMFEIEKWLARRGVISR